MTPDVAKEILQVAIDGDYKDDKIPKDEDEAVKEAEFYLQHAVAAAETDSSDDTILKIVELGKSNGFVEEAEEKESAEESETFSVSKTIEHDHLPIPRQIQGDPPEMPFDISECSDKQIRRLASQFQACLNRAIWQLRQTMDKLLRAKQLRAAAYRKAYLAEEAATRAAGVKPTKEGLDLAAQESPEFRELDTAVFELEAEQGDYKALKEIYEGNVSRLSREATLRDDEYKRSGR